MLVDVETLALTPSLGDVANPWDLAPAFVAAGLDLPWLEEAARAMGDDALSATLNWVADTLLATALVDQIEDANRRIAQLVSVVKEYSYVDRSVEREIDIHEGIEKTLIIVGHKLRAGIEVIRDYDDTLPRVLANGSELNQVWTNLIDKAIDTMAGHGQIRIRTRHVDHTGWWRSLIMALGFPTRSPIVCSTRFFTTKDVGKGTGLGLDIVRTIVVDRCHGEITFASKPGETSFLIRLPLTANA